MPDDPRVTVKLLGRTDFAVKATLSTPNREDRKGCWGVQWQDVLNDTGFGKLTLANDDPNLALVEYGDFLQFWLDGAPRFLSIVEKQTRVEVAENEEVDEATTISGRGALAYLEDAVVYPDFYVLPNTAPISDVRVFNFAAFDAIADISDPPYDYGDRAASTPEYTNMPADFPPVFSHWLGPEAPDGGGSNQFGDWYFFALIFGLPTQVYRLFLGYDDAIDLWIDNVPILRNEDAAIGVTKTVDLFLDETIIHWVAARITNKNNGAPINPSAITMALCTMNPDQSVDAEWWATDPADPSQYVSPFPTVGPAYTPGLVMHDLIVLEAQDAFRGALPLLNTSFTADVDSNGAAWAELINPSFQIGIDCLSAVKQLAESYFDVTIDPATLTLNLYQTLGSASAAEFEPAVNITELVHNGTF